MPNLFFFWKFRKNDLRFSRSFAKKGAESKSNPLSFDIHDSHFAGSLTRCNLRFFHTNKSCHLVRLPAKCGLWISKKRGAQLDSASFSLKLYEKRKSLFWDFFFTIFISSYFYIVFTLYFLLFKLNFIKYLFELSFKF